MSSRRDFFSSLRGLVKKEKQEEAFAPFAPFFDTAKMDACKTCETPSCVASCLDGVIKREDAQPPKLDFSLRGCSFCGDCAVSCDKDVFKESNDAKIYASIEIDAASCMAWHNTICKSCFDPCLDKAIDFLGLFYPSINPKKCTACGFCIGVCPANAITIKRSHS
jgi:ferredoxin-type protein NapF